MKKNRPAKQQDYTIPGIAITAILLLVVLAAGWYMAKILNPPVTGELLTDDGPLDRQYLVYRTERVLSRGDSPEPNDDTVVYEFFRYPLDGSALRGESIFRIERERQDDGVGQPWMKQVARNILLFARREQDSTAAAWIDVSGNELLTTDETTADVIWSGLPAPDGTKTVYYNWTTGRVVVAPYEGLPTEYDLGTEQAFEPVAWGERSNLLYLKAMSEGGLPVAGLWRLNTANGSADEITAVRELKLYDFDIDVVHDRLVGATFVCATLEECGTGPSSLHMVDLIDGTSIELFSDDHLAFGNPRISSDATRVGYTMSNGRSDVWCSGLDVAGRDEFIISGRLLDWTADKEKLVVERDGRLQIVSIADQTIVTVAERSGSYQDPDFHGLEYIGIVSKQ
jgi:hypothetical protein